jgi:hypothetical protein
MRHEISLREISLGSLPKHWLRSLLRRRWFRDALHRGPAPSVESGDDRSLPVSLGPLPRPEFYPQITVLARRLASEHVRRWTGVAARPHRVRLLRGIRSDPLPRSPFFTTVRREWAFLWPARLALLLPRHPEWLAPPSFPRRTWVEDHPFLVSRCETMRGDLRGGGSGFRRVPDPLVAGIPMGGVVFCER